MFRRGAILASVGLALLVGGCDPLERRYVTEGAGVDLFTTDRVNQIELLNAYERFICAQVGPACGSDWVAFVQAGMNDIDLRCDGFLTWLDSKRRDREPILAQISAINTAVHAIMTVTGSSPSSLNIVTSAFGLASATYANWNSRLLISVNQSTVQEIVYNSQGDYRRKIRDFTVTDRPTAIYLLRNYLRICMPTTIEANINTSTTMVQRGPAAAAAIAREGSLVVANVQPGRPAIIRDINAPLRRFEPRPSVVSDTRIGRNEQTMSAKDLKAVLDILGCTGSDLGPPGSPARRTLTKLLTESGRDPSDRVTPNVFIDLREIRAEGRRGTCSG